MRTLTFRDAICEALDEELNRDPSVVFFGEDIAAAGGVFATSRGLSDHHDSSRVFDTPISELALTGAAFGAAVCGLRPVIEIMFGDFLGLSMDSLINQAAKYWYLSNGQSSVPLVVRSAVGGGGRFGAIHSQTPIPWFYGVPGLKIVAPAFVPDAKALLIASIRDDNPVLFFEHKRLYSMSAELPDAAEAPPRLGTAKVVRHGSDVTLVSAMRGVHDCLEAATQLAADGINAEVIDLATVRPMDTDTILESLAKTNRLIAVDETPAGAGWSSDLLATAAEEALGNVDALARITPPSQPIPYSPPLEDAFFPDGSQIAKTVRERVS